MTRYPRRYHIASDGVDTVSTHISHRVCWCRYSIHADITSCLMMEIRYPRRYHIVSDYVDDWNFFHGMPWHFQCPGTWRLLISSRGIYLLGNDLPLKLDSLTPNEMYINITVTSKQGRWRLKPPASRLFTQPFIQSQIKGKIKAPPHWPVTGEFPAQRTSNAENVSIWWNHHEYGMNYNRFRTDQL